MRPGGLYQNPRNVDIKNKPAAQTNNTPELDHNDPAASERVFVLGFGSRFSKTTEDPARRIYKCTPDLNSKLIDYTGYLNPAKLREYGKKGASRRREWGIRGIP